MRIAGKEHLTPESVALTLEIPEDLREVFTFRPGQFVNVRAEIDGKDVRRSYSICAIPEDGALRIGVKKVSGGRFSTYANDVLQPGDTIEVMAPQGKFTIDCDTKQGARYVFFAAGSGITPVISLIRHILRSEPRSGVILFYGNRTTDSIMFKEELEGLKNDYVGQFSLHHILSREKQTTPLYNGHIDPEKCEHYARVFFDPEEVRRFFICGPPQMIASLRGWLRDRGVDAAGVQYELFGSAGEVFQKNVHTATPVIDPSRESLVSVQIDGITLDFPLAYGGESILEAAVDAGADAPFSCKGGVCCTCKAKLVEGKVDMDVVYGLEPEEIEAGFILTCQSHPRTERVQVDYDIR